MGWKGGEGHRGGISKARPGKGIAADKDLRRSEKDMIEYVWVGLISDYGDGEGEG
jgi:hypothetical protein